MDKISEHISYREATKSTTAARLDIDNSPEAKELERMKYVAQQCFEPARVHVNARIYIASFYRSFELNKAIGGSLTSFHPFGAAIDADADPYGETTNREIFLAILRKSRFTELIYEYPNADLSDCSWVHMACVKGREDERSIRIKYPGKSYRLITQDELQKILNHG